jgi:hypothetical protein
MNERDMRDEIGLERAIKIQENKKNDDGNEPDPEPLLLGSIVRHIRRLVVCPNQDGKSFLGVVKTGWRLLLRLELSGRTS